MTINDLKRKLIGKYTSFRGYKTDRKIIVFESDDWGSIRMPSKEVYTNLLDKGYPVDRLSYLKYDSLESNSDLEMLFEVLTSFKDKNGNHPVITANTIVSNPDFEKIRASNFLEYHSELFTETLKRYPNHERVFELHKLGIQKKIFYPQLHGMEHVNVGRWMKALQTNNKAVRFAFDHELFDLSEQHTEITENSFVDALHPAEEKDLEFQAERLKLATKLFKDLYGFESKTFIAPCYIWNEYHEDVLSKSGIELMQCGTFQLKPKMGIRSGFSKKLHYTGETNRSNQKYSTRNVSFEPSLNNTKTIINDTLNQIDRAFKNKKPAIISTHRVNFIGFIDSSNRERTVDLMANLINKILELWPDVEFKTSEDINQLLR